MKILLVYPQYPDSYWSYRHALRFISKKAALPPLGLITVSSMLPDSWEKRLVDLNTDPLKTRDIMWADYIFISAMNIQKESVVKIINQCAGTNAKIVAGGPLFIQEWQNFQSVDHFILNEAELTLHLFLKDLREGIPKRVYSSSDYADMNETPVPDYHLLKLKYYASWSMQISRGCPFNCDFCEITSLLGHKVRMKSTAQIIAELDKIYQLGWRGPIFIVDDNFIGNKTRLKNDFLPALKNWMRLHRFPFSFNVEASINLADDEELMTLMREAGFNAAFIGIETPDEQSLQACNKVQNNNRNLLENVRKIQRSGILVTGGFIVGFDSDTPFVFQNQIDFIQKSGIVSAMVGLLNAPKNTSLYKRLESENRIINDYNGNNTDYNINFIPKMDYHDLIEGYNKIIQSIYSIKPYYKRIRQLLVNLKQPHTGWKRISFPYLMGFLRSVIIIGVINKGRSEYWKLFLWTLFNRPGSLVDAVTLSVYGYHFRVIYGLTKNR